MQRIMAPKKSSTWTQYGRTWTLYYETKKLVSVRIADLRRREFTHPFNKKDSIPEAVRIQVDYLLEKRGGAAGFTILELCIVLGIGFMILACSLPSINTFTGNARLSTTTNKCIGMMRLAREQAISTGVMHEVRFKPMQSTIEVWERDWDGGVPEQRFVRAEHIDRRIIMMGGPLGTSVIFRSDGTANATGTIKFVEKRSRNRNFRICSWLAATGKVVVK